MFFLEKMQKDFAFHFIEKVESSGYIVTTHKGGRPKAKINYSWHPKSAIAEHEAL